MFDIKMAQGWVRVERKEFRKPTRVQTLLEQMGVDADYDAVTAYSEAIRSYVKGKMDFEHALPMMKRRRNPVAGR